MDEATPTPETEGQEPAVGGDARSEPAESVPVERRTKDGRILTAAQWAVLDANKIQPGERLNPKGNSSKARFRAALRRRLALQMRAEDEDELDQLADEVIAAAKSRSEGAVAMLKECWAREDGPLQTRLAGPEGEAIVPLVLFNVDPDAMREGRQPACPATPSEAPPSS